MVKDSQRIALSKRFVVYFLFFLSYQLIYAGRDWRSYLNGHLDLTASPVVGQTATLRLRLESNLAESVKVEIVFRLPDGIIAELPELIESQVYLSAYYKLTYTILRHHMNRLSIIIKMPYFLHR